MSSANNNDTSATEKRLAELEAQLDKTLAQTRQKAMILRIVAVLAVGLMGFYFYYAHKQIEQFDTEAVADILQHRLTEALPDASRQISASLKSQAPSVVADAEARLLQVPHELIGIQLKGYLQHHVAEQIRVVEDEFYATVKAQIDNIKTTHLSNRPQPLDEKETIALLDQVLATYGQQASIVLDNVYHDYANQADALIGYMHKLASNQSLSRREQLHRDLLQTFLALMDKHRGEGGLKWDKVFGNPLEANVPVN